LKDFSNIKITNIDLYKFNLKLKTPFTVSLGTIKDTQNVLVRINTNTEIYGWGEAAPYGPITGGTQETNYRIGHTIAKLLLGRNPLIIEQRISEINNAFAFESPIKAAFDMALYDLLGKFLEVPLYTLLGGENRELYTDLTIGMKNSIESTIDSVNELLRLGFKSIKLKVGRENLRDIEYVKAVRESIGPNIPLRIDANQGWNLVAAINNLKAMEPYNLEYAEQPLPAWDVLNFKRLKRAVSIPICVDESVFNQFDAFKLASLGACDIINIKLGKSGGIHTALKINAIAESAGIKCMVGCFFESRLGLSAAFHLALSKQNIHYIDLDSAHHLAEDPILGGMFYDENKKSLIKISNQPGHGADIKEDFLENKQHLTVK
jgi:o-succinylbenzoate synthase